MHEQLYNQIGVLKANIYTEYIILVDSYWLIASENSNRSRMYVCMYECKNVLNHIKQI